MHKNLRVIKNKWKKILSIYEMNVIYYIYNI